MSWPVERMFGSIRARLLFSLCGGLGMLMLGLFALLDYGIDRQIFGHLDEILLERAHDIARRLETQPGTAALDRLRILHPEYADGGHTDFLQLWDAHGRVLLGSANNPDGRLVPPPAPPPANAPRFYDLRLPDGHRGRAVALRLSPHDGTDEAVLAVAQEREQTEALEDRVHLALILGAFGAGILATLLAVLAVRDGLRPLLDFGRAAGREDAPFADRLPVMRMPRELKPFAVSLNTALDRLNQALARERRFARDVAHELRTPLAELRVTTQLAQRDAADPMPLDDALGTIGRMQRCIDALLALSRYEAGMDRPQLEPLDLVVQVRQALDAMASQIARHGLVVEAALPTECWVSSDPALLERILDNLISNAVEYAPPRSRLHIVLEPCMEGMQLRIGNQAPGLGPEDLVHLGERFWRKSPAREASRHGGLGLALAQTLAGVLGLELGFAFEDGTLWATLAPLRDIVADALRFD